MGGDGAIGSGLHILKHFVVSNLRIKIPQCGDSARFNHGVFGVFAGKSTDRAGASLPAWLFFSGGTTNASNETTSYGPASVVSAATREFPGSHFASNALLTAEASLCSVS